jgi:pimeloyl-ACP methyl ester carboxylesterase
VAERVVLTLVLGVSGCQSPTERIDHFAVDHAIERAVVTGTMFRHIIMRNQAPPGSALHVYIEGDGAPFASASSLAVDPTARHPVMLQLMALDPQRAVYVGRPCYLGLRTDSVCNSAYWSLRRFSPEVVESMAAVIRAEMRLAGESRVDLFGHSGGGALAVLLTRELPVRSLITLAGNLDTKEWTQLHGYTMLSGSLNPIDVTLKPSLSEHTIHFVGSNDKNVPAALVRHAAERIGGSVREIPMYTHQCCWQALWPSVLLEVQSD